jgi:hypothetical protein
MRTLAFLSLVFVATVAAAVRDTPGTPNNVKAETVGPDAIQLSWVVTSRREENVKFEVEARLNDAPVNVQQPDGTSGTGAGWLGSAGYVVRRLQPEQHYCFRVWSRYVDNDVRSERPSNWVCADTTAVPPLAPLDFTATFVPGQRHAILHWNTPDQSGHRPVQFYEIERQSPPGPNRPILKEGRINGPNGEQSVTTRLNFMFKSSDIPLPGKHAFRVCSVNSGGRVCSAQVAPTADNKVPTHVAPHTAHQTPSRLSTRDASGAVHQSVHHGLGGSMGCKADYVRREATPPDTVCVTPKAHDRIQTENQNAPRHREAKRPDVCKPGYVWRAATPDDHVCVTPHARDLAQEENAHASRHKAE